MAMHAPLRATTRGTILVASPISSFTTHVVSLVEAAGYTAALRVAGEPAWLTCTRTRPALVIVDGTPGSPELLELLDEVMVRRLPLLVAHAGPAYELPRLLGTHTRLGWLPPSFTAADLGRAADALLGLGGGNTIERERRQVAQRWVPPTIASLGREGELDRVEPDPPH